MKQFNEDLKNYRHEPSNLAWERIENKLEHRKSRDRIVKFRNISIAAVMVSLFAIIGVMSLYLNSYNPEVFATSNNFKPVQMEALEESDESLYNFDYLKQLNSTYEDKVGKLF